MGGYTAMVEKMFGDTEILLNTEFRTFIEEHSGIADRIIYCGPIDEYFDYKLGNLEYRSLRFETESVDSANWQGNAVVNYTEREIPFTRIIEHKHFEFGDQQPPSSHANIPPPGSRVMSPTIPSTTSATPRSTSSIANLPRARTWCSRVA